MIKKIIISSLLIVFGFAGYAQRSYSLKALKAYQEGETDLAIQYTDSAIRIPAENRDVQTWLIRGYVYFDAHKKDVLETDSTLRKTSEDAFRRALYLDSSKTYEERILKGVYNLAVTYYNDAVNSMNAISFSKAEPYYQKYRELTILARPNTNMKDKDLEFYNALGSLLQTLYTDNKKTKSYLWDQALKAYQTSYSIDSNNRSANYHIAILYYNKGVDLILSLPPDADLPTIFETQDKTVVLFLKSRPYMQRAYYLDPKNKNVILGLKGIYYELNDKEQIEFWDKKLKELEEESGK